MKDVYRQLIYNDKKSSFKELLETVPIHIKNLQFLATEIFKVHRNISLSIVKQLFQSRNNVTIHDNFQKVRSVFRGTESISFHSPKIRNIVANEFNKDTLSRN